MKTIQLAFLFLVLAAFNSCDDNHHDTGWVQKQESNEDRHDSRWGGEDKEQH